MKKDVWTLTGKNGKEKNFEVEKNRKAKYQSPNQQFIPFPEDEMEIYCEEGYEDIFCKDMYQLYTFLEEVEVPRREQTLREICPEISDEMLQMALDCFAIIERKKFTFATEEKLTNKEMKRLQKEEDNLTFPY